MYFYTYLHRDHLGSITTITDSAGSVLERLSYDSYGKRRSATTWQAGSITAAEIRGYTGHEHLDDVGLIHMNGRVYDPSLGRMLSPDPVTQSPENAQNDNRYAYVMNSPTRFMDPSGYECEDAISSCSRTLCTPCAVGFNVNSVPANWPYGFTSTIYDFSLWMVDDPFGIGKLTEEDWKEIEAEYNDRNNPTNEKPEQGEVVGREAIENAVTQAQKGGFWKKGYTWEYVDEPGFTFRNVNGDVVGWALESQEEKIADYLNSGYTQHSVYGFSDEATKKTTFFAGSAAAGDYEVPFATNPVNPLSDIGTYEVRRINGARTRVYGGRP